MILLYIGPFYLALAGVLLFTGRYEGALVGFISAAMSLYFGRKLRDRPEEPEDIEAECLSACDDCGTMGYVEGEDDHEGTCANCMGIGFVEGGTNLDPSTPQGR